MPDSWLQASPWRVVTGRPNPQAMAVTNLRRTIAEADSIEKGLPSPAADSDAAVALSALAQPDLAYGKLVAGASALVLLAGSCLLLAAFAEMSQAIVAVAIGCLVLACGVMLGEVYWRRVARRRTQSFATAAAALQAARLEAEASSQAQARFLATTTHEIRTPMNGVIAMAGLLMDTELTADQRGYLETIHNSSESLLSIINDILDFSKIEAGKMELERRPFDLRACVEESLDLLVTRALEKRLELAGEVADEIPEPVEGDAQRLRQVLMNLVGNALKFTERGGVHVTVEKLSAAGAENPAALKLHFAVRDSGIGIPPDRLARLFRPFAQAEKSTARQYGGTGLGLVISRRLVELMGGRMWAESVPGEGSTFHFTATVTAPAHAAPPPFTRHQPKLADLKVLILEDDFTIRQLLARRCQGWGMLPQAVENSAQAMELLRAGVAFDLALVDATLPGLDGAVVAAELQKFPMSARLPVVLLTSLGGKENGGEARARFAHTVNKPLKPAQLCVVLEQALVAPPAPPAPATVCKTDGASVSARLPLRILVADDNAINQKVAVRILQQLGYAPTVAGNGREAVAAIERQPFDLVLMDVMMPELDGLEATKLIRQRQAGGGHPNFQAPITIVAMTAHAMTGDREKCLAAGMDDYLSKPVRPKDIRDMIEKWGGKNSPPTMESREIPAGPPAAEPPVDMARMNDLTDGNADNLRELVELYLTQTHKQFGQLQEAIAAGNADAVRRVAHSCAGASATLGMTQLVPLLRDLERLGASGTLTGAASICDSALAEFGRIREFLKTQPALAAALLDSNAA